MSGIQGGSAAAPSVTAIQSQIAGQLKLPASLGGTSAPNPNPVSTAVPRPESAPVETPAPAPTPNVSRAATDAGAIDLPDFTGGESEPPPTEAKVEAPKPEDDDSDLPTEPAAQNFKILREKIKEERKTKRQLAEEHAAAKAELEKFQKGENISEVLRAKDEAIQKLEPYKHIVDLKLSDEYQQAFIEPASELAGKLDKLGEDYGIPSEVIRQAVAIENKRDLNTYLTQHLNMDDVAALEARQIITEMQELGAQALEAEQKPVEAMNNLKAAYAERKQQEAQQRAEVFEATAKEAWNAALQKTAKEGAYKELIISPTNPEFNKNTVEPIQHRASIQYGALVKQLAANGLKQLPPELASGLARMVLLSIGGALTLDARVRAEREASQISETNRRIGGYLRPSMGGQNGSGHVPRSQNTGPANPREAARIAVSGRKS